MCSALLSRVSLAFILLFSPARTAAPEVSPHPPLKETDIVQLLVGRVSPIRLRALVQRYGIDFTVDSSLAVLNAAGADADLIKALRAAERAPAPPPILPAQPSPTAAPPRSVPTATPAPSPSPRSVDPEFVLVRGGPQGDVYLARHEVTNQEYWAYCRRRNLSRPAGPPAVGKPQARWPVVNITWAEAETYCRALSQDTGQRYRLPTETEWELGASAGDPRRTYPWGEQSPALRACFGKARLCAVGSFAANAAGLFDMAGSAAEWVTGKDKEPVVKGGSWADAFPEDNHKLAVSNHEKPDPRKPNYKVGFRVALEP